MTEPEVLFPVRCPICSHESLTGFRISVVADALSTGQIRLYSNCHVASWNASEAELTQMRDYLDTVWSTGLKEASEEFFSLDSFLDSDSLAFIYTGVLDAADLCDKRPKEGSDEFEGGRVEMPFDGEETFDLELETLKGEVEIRV
jgi:hypothetical protein